jgi:hypothetical protein
MGEHLLCDVSILSLQARSSGIKNKWSLAFAYSSAAASKT